jgi:hypothetical protein
MFTVCVCSRGVDKINPLFYRMQNSLDRLLFHYPLQWYASQSKSANFNLRFPEDDSSFHCQLLSMLKKLQFGRYSKQTLHIYEVSR